MKKYIVWDKDHVVTITAASMDDAYHHYYHIYGICAKEYPQVHVRLFKRLAHYMAPVIGIDAGDTKPVNYGGCCPAPN